MTEHDIRQFEVALQVALPAAYREFLLNPPFAEDSCSYEDLCLYGVHHLIEDNRRFRATAEGNSKLRPHERFLIIGSDHSESYYVLDLHDEALPVLEVGFGSSQEIVGQRPSFEALLSDFQRSEQEAAEDDAREAAAPAWPWSKCFVLAGFIVAWLAYIAYKAAKWL